MPNQLWRTLQLNLTLSGAFHLLLLDAVALERLYPPTEICVHDPNPEHRPLS